MANDNTNDVTIEPAKIEFIQFHQPILKDGDYVITVAQSVQTIHDSKIPATTFQTQDNKFSVAGERFAFSPALISSVFPPEGSLGEHSNVLPHVILNRSTLPWERMANENREDVPWLALLLFDDSESVSSEIVNLSELTQPLNNNIKWHGVELERGQHEDDKVTVIEVKRSLLENMMPAESDLSWLSHVRQGKDINGNVSGDELALIIANRLPRNGGISTAHLVSIEGRYNNDAFDYQEASPDDLIRLVSLKSWSFACVDKKRVFKGLLENLDPYHNVADFNKQRSSLRLPPQNNAPPDAEKYLSMGGVPLPHFLRQGSKTASWYHGPLIPCENTSSIQLPARAADELLRYNPSNGMLDVTYAAAWELGRLLCLQSKKISISLYQWKRAHAQQQIQAEQRVLHAHLPGQDNAPESVDIPDDIASWFNDLSLLNGVPFNYLVPDERMLPKESIRFFLMDRLWVDCLLDGAFSIGRVTTSDHTLDKELDVSPATNPYEKISGCLLRSDVVSGWHSLIVDAYDDFYNIDPDKGGKKLKLLRMDRLSANILLCLFTGGEMKRVEVHQKPEALHFGFDVHENPPFNLYKTFRDDKGEELDDENGNPVEIEISTGSDVWQQEAQRSINISNLAGDIRQKLKLSSTESFTSAQFALQMIEGVEKVIFQVEN